MTTEEDDDESVCDWDLVKYITSDPEEEEVECTYEDVLNYVNNEERLWK